MADIRQKAAATAYEYNQGNIAVLDDDMTRRLIASVALTESRGGNPELMSPHGFVGTFQYGAQALAKADFVDQAKLAEAMTGFKSEWAWAKSGGMSQFLETSENWNHGLSLDKFRQSPELQNEAFKRNAEQAYQRAVTDGLFKEGDRVEKIAGFLKVEHVMGYGHAKAAANGERVFRSPDGTSNYDYLHDITRNRDGLDKHLAQLRDASQAAPQQAAGAGLLLVSNPNHEYFKRYEEPYNLLKNVAFDSEEKRVNAAGFIAMKSMAAGIAVHSIIENKNGDLFPMQDPGKSHEKTFKVDRAEAESFPIAESTRQIDAWSRTTTVAQDNPQQVRTFSV